MRILRVFVCLAGAVAIALVSAAPAEAWWGGHTVNCGDTITRSIKLKEDLNCTGDGLIIGADYVTLDLGGHTIFGEPVSGTGVVFVGRKGASIRNGTIKGFDVAIYAANAENVKINNLRIVDRGILIGDSRKVVIKNTTFNGYVPSPTFGDAVWLISVHSFLVQNIDVHGPYVTGITLSGDGLPANGTIEGSTFMDSYIAVIVDDISDVRIRRNHMMNVGVGFQAGSFGPVSSLAIKENHIHGNGYGIVFDDVIDSVVSANHVWNNDEIGILLRTKDTGSTGNRIISNITFGNGFKDLFHDDLSTPNVWRGNSWETCYGTDIPGCPEP